MHLLYKACEPRFAHNLMQAHYLGKSPLLIERLLTNTLRNIAHVQARARTFKTLDRRVSAQLRVCTNIYNSRHAQSTYIRNMASLSELPPEMIGNICAFVSRGLISHFIEVLLT